MHPIDSRGFVPFNAFLVDLCATRARGQTLADLSPQIVVWFAQHERAAAPS